MENTTDTTTGAGNLSAALEERNNVATNLLAELDKAEAEANKIATFHKDALQFVNDILVDPYMEDSRKLSLIAGTMIHDLAGVIHHSSCFHSGLFVPRCDGWSKDRV